MAVSKALRDEPDISPETKARVNHEAERLAYVPNRIARNLRGGQSKGIGLIVPWLHEPFAAHITSGLEQEAERFGYELFIAASHDQSERELARVEGMLQRHVEALFVLPVIRLQHRSPLFELARKHEVPLIFLDRYPAGATQYAGVGWVVMDHVRAGELAARYLIELGHKNFIYLSAPLAASSTSEHFVGFTKELKRAGISFSEAAAFSAGADANAGQQAMEQALVSQIPFSAVICGADTVAVGAMQTLRSRGYRIPQDVSIIGYGGGTIGELTAPPLTTIQQLQMEMGRAAFRLWDEMRGGIGIIGGKVLSVEIIARQSTETARAPRLYR